MPSSLFTDEEWNAVLLYTAKYLAYHQGAFRELDKIYVKNEYDFHVLVEKHPLRHCRLMVSMPLEYEIKTAHMLGVMAAAEKDNRLREKIIQQMRIVSPKTFDYWRDPTEKNRNNYFTESKQQKDDVILQNVYFYNYFYENLDFNKMSDVRDGQYQYCKKVVHTELFNLTEYTALGNSVFLSNMDSNLQTITKSWGNILDYQQTIKDIVGVLVDLKLSSPFTEGIQIYSNYIIGRIKEKFPIAEASIPIHVNYTCDSQNMEDIEKILDVPHTLESLCQFVDVDYRELISCTELKKAEQKELIFLSLKYKFDFIHNWSNVLQSDYSLSWIHDGSEFDLLKYVYNLFIYRLLQEYKKAKEQYFRDNEEYRLLEQKRQQKKHDTQQQKIKELEQRVSRLSEENHALSEENRRLRAQPLDVERDIRKEYELKVKQLEQKIAEQQQELYDVAPLRDFVFSLESIGDFAEERLSFSEYKKYARIASLGGHENLRKRLKQNFPDLLVMDGTLRSINFSTQLQNIDILFVFTDHMSHAVYYNAVAAAERYQIKLVFLHATNVETIEQKMASTIKLWLEEKR